MPRWVSAKNPRSCFTVKPADSPYVPASDTYCILDNIMKLVVIAALVLLLTLLAVIQIDADFNNSRSSMGSSSISNDSASGSNEVEEISIHSLRMDPRKSYVVGLRNINASNRSFCVGALIAPQYVPTSNFCF